jgi:hypothetical protein
MHGTCDCLWNNENKMTKMTVTKVAKPSMPKITEQQCSEDGVADVGAGVLAQWIKIVCGITSEQNCLRLEILDRKTKRIKFNRNPVITSEGANRDQILNKTRRDHNIVQR